MAQGYSARYGTIHSGTLLTTEEVAFTPCQLNLFIHSIMYLLFYYDYFWIPQQAEPHRGVYFSQTKAKESILAEKTSKDNIIKRMEKW